MLATRTTAAGFLFFALAWLAYDHYPPWMSFHSEALALYGMGLLAVGRCFRRDTDRFIAPRPVWVIFAAGLLPWVQYLAGISFFAGDALVVSLYFCALTTAIWLGYGYALEPDETSYALTGVFFMIWFAALVSAAIGLVQWLNLNEPFGMYMAQTDIGDRAMGNLGQPNQLATLLLMGIASLAWTFERKRMGHLGLIFGVTFLTLVLALSRSRAGLISALVVGAFLLWKHWAQPGRLKPGYVVVWLLIYGAFLLLTPQLQDFLMLGESRSMNVAIDSARPIIWNQVLTGISQAPWFGYGWNQTPAAQAAGSIGIPGSWPVTYAHNIVLDILAWNGLPLGFLLTGLCGWWFLSRFWQVSQPAAVYAMAALIPVLVHSMAEFPFAYAYFLLAAAMMVGIVEAFHRGVKTIAFDIRWMSASLAVWFILGSYMAYEYLQIEKDFVVVRFENLRVGQTPADYAAPDILLLSHMGTMLNVFRQKAAPHMSLGELEELRRTSLRFPYGALSLRYALALGLNGSPAEATRQFATMRGLYGPVYYQAAVDVLRELQRDKYPELALVLTP